jgi:hypothetical protein
MTLPDEVELMSLFESEPILSSKNVPYFYNTVKYSFLNKGKQSITITLEPANNEFSITVIDSGNTLANLQLKPIDTFTILTDNRNEKKIMLIGESFGIKLKIQPQFQIDLESTIE